MAILSYFSLQQAICECGSQVARFLICCLKTRFWGIMAVFPRHHIKYFKYCDHYLVKTRYTDTVIEIEVLFVFVLSSKSVTMATNIYLSNSVN